MMTYYNPYRFTAQQRQLLQTRDDYYNWFSDFTEISAQIEIHLHFFRRLRALPDYDGYTLAIDQIIDSLEQYCAFLAETLTTIGNVLPRFRKAAPPDETVLQLCEMHVGIRCRMNNFRQLYTELATHCQTFSQQLIEV
jgi:hypothetical protein